MREGDCKHPESEMVVVSAGDTFMSWCSTCGSIWDNNGDHGAAAGSWRAPSGLVLPGWTCACGIFTGSMKGATECRCCGRSKP